MFLGVPPHLPPSPSQPFVCKCWQLKSTKSPGAFRKKIIIIIASRAFSKIPGEVQFQVIYQLPGEVQVVYQEKGAMGHPSQTLGLVSAALCGARGWT